MLSIKSVVNSVCSPREDQNDYKSARHQEIDFVASAVGIVVATVSRGHDCNLSISAHYTRS